MIDADRTRLDAIYNRIAQHYEKVFPVNAGWRPNIHVSNAMADTNSIEYETIQMDYMIRAITAAQTPNLCNMLKQGLHIKQVMTKDTRVIYPENTPTVNAKLAERWLSLALNNPEFFANQVTETKTNLGSAVEAIERFTQGVYERLARIGLREHTIHFNMLVPHEQRQFEQLYTRIVDIRDQVAEALRDVEPVVLKSVINDQIKEIEDRVRSRIHNGNANTPTIVHPDEGTASAASANPNGFGRLPIPPAVTADTEMLAVPASYNRAAPPYQPTDHPATNPLAAHPLAQSASTNGLFPLHFLQAVLQDRKQEKKNAG